MAVTREQAILEMVLEFGDLLRNFDVVSRRYQDTVQQIRTATDRADIDQLEREAEGARVEMERLGREARDSLRKIETGSEEAGIEVGQLRQETNRLDRAIDGAEKELSAFNREGGKVDRVTSSVGRLRAAWAAAAGAVVVLGIGIRAVIDATDKQAAAEAQVRAAIKSTGGAAGVTAKELKKMASELQSVTTVGDETILGIQSLLLTFTKLRKEELPEITERVLDVATSLAAASGGALELRGAALQVGKALNDPIRGVSALVDAGIQFTEQQKEQIKTLVESNRLYDAQRIILDELETQFGGRARAAANTFKGSLEQLKNTAGDLLEKVGQKGLNTELTVLSRGLKETAEGSSSAAESIGTVVAFVAKLGSRFLVLFELARGAIAASQAATIGGLLVLYSAVSRVFTAIEDTAVGVVRRITTLIPETDLPGQADDALRKFVGRIEARLSEGRDAAQAKREEIQEELRLLAEGFAGVSQERFDAADTLFQRLEKVRKEIESAGEAAAGPLATGLGEAGDALDEFRTQLFGNADALRANADLIVELVQSLGGLGAATAAQRDVIGSEVQKLLDGFARVGEAPPVALSALAHAMGITASSIKADAEGATAALRGLVDAAEEVARVPSTRFSADLDLDEEAIRGRLAQVQAELEGLRGGFKADPGREFGLLEEESRLLGDLQRAERAYQDVVVDTNRARGETSDLSDEHIRLLRQEGALTEELAAGLGLTADQLQRANAGFQGAGDGLGGLVESGTEASQVTLPALDDAALDAARSSGALDESLQAISENLLVTAGNAEKFGEGLATAGKHGAEAQKQAAEETKSAAEQIAEQDRQVVALTESLRELGRVQQEVLAAGVGQWAAYRVEMGLSLEACEQLRSCQGGG